LELDYFTIYDHFLDLEINTVRREVKGEGGREVVRNRVMR
jgi:hypothetical protein